MLVFQEDRQIFIVVPLVLDKRTRTQIYKGKIRTDKGFIAGASYGGLEMKNSLNECRSCRLTGGTNSRIPLRNQDLSIVGRVDPDTTI